MRPVHLLPLLRDHATRLARLTALVPLSVLIASCGGGDSSSTAPPPAPHTIGGTVSSLSGSGLVLLDNGTDMLPVSANPFTFAQSLATGNTYNVTISSQPTNPTQTCTVAHGMGTISGSDITNVAVTCTTNTYTVGGSVSGLTGSGLVMDNNGGNNLPITSSGPFTFTTAIASGNPYNVGVATQPTNPPQTCAVGSSSGTIAASNVTNVTVTCTTNTYSVGGHVSGLAGSGLTLSYNGGAPLAVPRNGAFTAAINVAIGTAYTVAIVNQPTNPSQPCTLSNGSGTVGTVNVTSISVFCPQSVGRFAYVVGAGYTGGPPSAAPVLGTVSVYTIDPGSGTLTLLPGSTVQTGPHAGSLIFVPHSLVAMTVNGGDHISASYFDGSVYEYTVNASTGLLTAVAGSPFTTLSGTSTTPNACGGRGSPGDTRAVTFDPTGMFGYVTNGSFLGYLNIGVWEFTIDPTTGVPNLVPGTEVAACYQPWSVTIDPSGQFAYVPSFVVTPSPGAALYAFTINAVTGALVPVAAAPYVQPAAAGGDGALTIEPTGRFAYQPDYNNNEIWAFAIDSSTGALTPIAGSPFATGSTPTSIAIEPRGQFLYLVASGGVYTYAINNSTGALTVATGSSLVALSQASALQIDPSGQFAYTTAIVGAGQTGVYGYTIDSATGALTPMPGSPFAPSAFPGNPTQLTVTN
jgi:6-phosphogluconolactonase (cycloisomerase 2 family)